MNRYEGPRNAEALAEYVNKEGGTFVEIVPFLGFSKFSYLDMKQLAYC